MGVADSHLTSDVRITHRRGKRETQTNHKLSTAISNVLIVSSTTLITVSIFNLSQRRNGIEIPLHERLMKISRKGA